jgi:DNA modification methylase
VTANYFVIPGDMREVLAQVEPDYFDACVTDPPYELGFMGKAWDSTGIAYDPETWRAVYRVLKPGAHLLAFGGTRTFHRIAVAIEDAGFEIRDTLSWLYGSGFPKGRNISKAIDAEAGATREVVGRAKGAQVESTGRYGAWGNAAEEGATTSEYDVTEPATDEAKKWEGWNTALKPAWEPIIVARKPLAKGRTVAGNVVEYGTGAYNIEATRIPGDVPQTTQGKSDSIYGNGAGFSPTGSQLSNPSAAGRWPANVLLDEVSAEMLDAQTGVTKSTSNKRKNDGTKMGYHGAKVEFTTGGFDDSGGASRFFYVSKASRSERNAGVAEPEIPSTESHNLISSKWIIDARHPDGGYAQNPSPPRGNSHPTVKPIDLMRYLIRLVVPQGAMILDPFNGSGSTGCAAVLEGVNYAGIDLDPDNVVTALQRLAYWSAKAGNNDA